LWVWDPDEVDKFYDLFFGDDFPFLGGANVDEVSCQTLGIFFSCMTALYAHSVFNFAALKGGIVIVFYPLFFIPAPLSVAACVGRYIGKILHLFAPQIDLQRLEFRSFPIRG